MTFRNLLTGLLGAAFGTTPGYKKFKQVENLNDTLGDLHSEIAALNRIGQSIHALVFNAASLSVGQLDVLLDGATGLEQFRKRISTPLTFMSLNPLYEYNLLLEKKAVG